MTNEVNGETVLSGPVVEQAALHSLLIKKVHTLNLTLISVLRIETDSTGEIGENDVCRAPLRTLKRR